MKITDEVMELRDIYGLEKDSNDECKYSTPINETAKTDNQFKDSKTFSRPRNTSNNIVNGARLAQDSSNVDLKNNEISAVTHATKGVIEEHK